MAHKKKRNLDYTLNIFQRYDEQLKQNVVVFLVQTTKIFVSFRYEILLEDSRTAKDIYLKIVGLHVPELLMPQTGPARGRRDYQNLNGQYTLHVTKQDRTLDIFQIEISSSSIEIKQKPRNPFILVSSDSIELL